MLGDFLTRLLILVLGYAYPAFECFKTVEKNKVQIEELRFWCQYWIIVAFLTVFERVGDIFISWLPMYGEMKLTLFIYLWYPTTKGSGYVYGTLLRPYMVKYEPDVDRKIQEFRARAWDFALYYWQNCTELGQAKFFEILQYMAGQSQKFKNGDQKSDKKNPEVSSNSSRSHPGKSKNSTPTKINRNVVQPPKSKVVEFQPDSPSENDLNDDSNSDSPTKSKLEEARLNLRRAKPQN